MRKLFFIVLLQFLLCGFVYNNALGATKKTASAAQQESCVNKKYAKKHYRDECNQYLTGKCNEDAVFGKKNKALCKAVCVFNSRELGEPVDCDR